MSEDNLRASLGAEHMQPVDREVCGCGEIIVLVGGAWKREGREHLVPNCRMTGGSHTPKPQPAPAPREISDAECDKFIEDALLSSYSFASNTRKIARYAIRQIESARAPQTAPRDPYKRGQLLP